MASSPSRPLSFLGGPSSPSTGALYPHQDLSIPTPGPLYPHQELSISIPRLGLVGSQKPLKSLLGQVLLPKGPAADSTHPDWMPWLLITQPPSGRLLSKCVTPNSYQGFSCTPIHPPRLSPGWQLLIILNNKKDVPTPFHISLGVDTGLALPSRYHKRSLYSLFIYSPV